MNHFVSINLPNEIAYYEQIYNNSTEETKVIYSGFLAGLLPSGPGHSHQAVRDIASMSGMHNLEMIQPNSEKQVENGKMSENSEK